MVDKDRVKQILKDCENICLAAASSWSANTPDKMAKQCASLINAYARQRGYGSGVPYANIQISLPIREYMRLRRG